VNLARREPHGKGLDLMHPGRDGACACNNPPMPSTEPGPPLPDGDLAGRAWARWTATLQDLSVRLTADDFPTDDRGRAEGIRHLARQAGLALQGELEHADPRHPRLHRYELPWSQWGAPNPDNVYQRCAIDPEADHVLRGRVDGVHEALFSLVQGDMHLDENDVYAEVALSDLTVGDDGSFELVVGPGDHAGNHLRSADGARMLLIRQYLYDWGTEPVASFSIERVDTAGEPAPAPTGTDIAAAVDRAGRWVERSIDYWAAYVAASRDLLAHNTFTAPNTPPGGAPSIAYGGGCWDLEPGQVLLVEHDRPDAHYWNWSIHNLHWFDSGDWDQRLMSCNGHQAHVDTDGVVRVVVAHDDPGTPNWLDTEGRPVGMAVYRYVGAATKPVPTARVLAADALRAALPGDHPVVGPDDRRRQRAERSRAAQRRWS
jgi:hypothetical protein